MRLVLAPLAEYTDAAFRRMCHEGGADLTYTEMVSAAALYHGSSPTRHLMEKMPGEGPVVCQLFGCEPDELAFAAREAASLRDGDSPRFGGDRPRFSDDGTGLGDGDRLSFGGDRPRFDRRLGGDRPRFGDDGLGEGASHAVHGEATRLSD